MRFIFISILSVCFLSPVAYSQQAADTASHPAARRTRQGAMQGLARFTRERRSVISFGDETNADLSDASKATIDAHMGLLRSDTTAEVLVIDRGSSPDSELVTRRLSAVKGYLVTKGINASRIFLGTRGTGWSTDTVATEGAGTGKPDKLAVAEAERRDPRHDLLIIIAKRGTAPKKAS